jgi:transcriptional regulator with XRE-family HTH domain
MSIKKHLPKLGCKMSKKYQGLGERAKERRKELGLTLREVAASVGMTDVAVCRIEQRGSSLRPTIDALARALQVSPEWLMGLSDEKQKLSVDDAELDSILSAVKYQLLVLARLARAMVLATWLVSKKAITSRLAILSR